MADERLWGVKIRKSDYERAEISCSGDRPGTIDDGDHVILYSSAPFSVRVGGESVKVTAFDSMKELIGGLATRWVLRNMLVVRTRIRRNDRVIVLDEEPFVAPRFVELYYMGDLEDLEVSVKKPGPGSGMGKWYTEIDKTAIKKSRRLRNIRATIEVAKNGDVLTVQSPNEMFWVVIPEANKVIPAKVVDIL